MGTCHDNQDRDLYPLWINLPAINEQAICSPEETKTSCSESEKLSLISKDFFRLKKIGYENIKFVRVNLVIEKEKELLKYIIDSKWLRYLNIFYNRF